jgi:hypothetical protein
MIEEQLYKMLTEYFSTMPFKIKPEIRFKRNLSSMGLEGPFQGPPQEIYSVEVNFPDSSYIAKSGKVEVNTIAGVQRLLGVHVDQIKQGEIKRISEARGVYEAMEHLIMHRIDEQLSKLWT